MAAQNGQQNTTARADNGSDKKSAKNGRRNTTVRPISVQMQTCAVNGCVGKVPPKIACLNFIKRYSQNHSVQTDKLSSPEIIFYCTSFIQAFKEKEYLKLKPDKKKQTFCPNARQLPERQPNGIKPILSFGLNQYFCFQNHKIYIFWIFLSRKDLCR